MPTPDTAPDVRGIGRSGGWGGALLSISKIDGMAREREREGQADV